MSPCMVSLVNQLLFHWMAGCKTSVVSKLWGGGGGGTALRSRPRAQPRVNTQGIIEAGGTIPVLSFNIGFLEFYSVTLLKPI